MAGSSKPKAKSAKTTSPEKSGGDSKAAAEEQTVENKLNEKELKDLKKLAGKAENLDSIEFIDNQEMMLEIGDDPVRLYLKEIGLVELPRANFAPPGQPVKTHKDCLT